MSFVAVAVTTAVVATGLSAYGSYQQGQAGKAMNKYQSDVLGQQAMLQQRQADQQMTITNIQAAENSKAAARRAASIAGTEKATMAANGVASDVTAADIAVDTFDTAKLDQMAIQYNADLKNWGTKEGLAGDLWNIGIQQKGHKMAGRNAAIAGNINAGVSILKGASQVASFGANGGMSGGSGGYSGATNAMAAY